MQVPETTPSTPASSSLQDIFADVGDDLVEVERLIQDKIRSDVELLEKTSRYIHQSGGKRIRPALLLLSARTCGYRGPLALQYATVMEIIHTATLVHDDIVDQATLRRGQTSVNSLLGNGVTVLLGDYLYVRSMRLALEMGSLEILEEISDVTLRMIEGMMLEITRGGSIDLSEEEHLDILQRKTACLFNGCARIGAILAGGSEERRRALADYGMNLGMAFQVVDDLLDFTAREEVLGKPVLQDLKEGHVTLPIIYALRADPSARPLVEAVVRRKSVDEASRNEILAWVRRHGALDTAREVAEQYSCMAKQALASLPSSSPKESLLALADYVVDRNR